MLRLAARMGWRFDGISGKGHLRLVHKRGAVAYLPGTPSDVRTEKNNLALLRRLERQNDA
jgi:hypothetical protein